MLYTTNAITQNKTNPSIPKFVHATYYSIQYILFWEQLTMSNLPEDKDQRERERDWEILHLSEMIEPCPVGWDNYKNPVCVNMCSSAHKN